MRRVYLFAFALVLVAIAYLFGTSLLNGTSSDARVAAFAPSATSVIKVDATAIPAAINLETMPSPRVLAWNPNKALLAWYAVSGQPVAIAQSTQKALITPCAAQPAAEQAVIFVGGNTKQAFLYPLGSGSPVSLGANLGLVCAVPDRLQVSPDGARLALIKYLDNSVEAKFTVGTLRVLKLPEATEQQAFDNVIAFDLQNDGVVFLQFFANTKGEANAADLSFYDGSKVRKLEENIKPLENCQFVTGRAIRAGDKVLTLLGEQCKQGGSKFRLLRTDFAGGNSANVISGPTGLNGGAKYLNNVGANNLWLLPSGKDILFSVPNGLESNVVDLARISLDNTQPATVLTSVELDQYPPLTGPRFLRSPKGDHLALITQTGDGAEKVFMYDLNALDTAPVLLGGGTINDRIRGIAWTADGQRLFFVINGDDNALISATGDGQTKRVMRGQFQNLAINADGSVAVMSMQRKVTATDLRNDLVQVNVNDGTQATLVEGAKGESALTPFFVR